jgi:hypothetical protein
VGVEAHAMVRGWSGWEDGCEVNGGGDRGGATSDVQLVCGVDGGCVHSVV